MKTLKRIMVLLFLLLFFQELVYAQIIPFRNHSIEAGLSESVANDLIQDEKGYIWVATGYGLNRFDGQQFKQYYEEDGLPSNKTSALYQDSQKRIWVGTDAGIAILYRDSLYTPENLSVLNNFPIISIFEDSEGAYWFGTDGGGLWKLRPEGALYSVSDFHDLNIFSIRSIAQSGDGSVWIASREGVVRISGDEVTQYCFDEGLPDPRARDVFIDSQDRIWIATRGGLALYQGGEFISYGEEHGLNDVRIYTITGQGENQIWVGTESGVSFFDGDKFVNYTRENGLPATIVYSSTTDIEGNIWFGTLGGGISYFSGEIFNSYNTDNGLPNNVITGFEEDAEGRLWVATYGGGVVRLDNGHMEVFNESDGLVDNKVYTFFRDSLNRMWIGTSEGISIYEDGTFTTLDPEEHPFTAVRKFFEDSETGDLWIATYNDGVFRVSENGYEQFYTGNVLTNNTVMDIKKDASGDLWFATYGGAVRYDGENFRIYTIADGLPSNGVIHIHVDHNDDKWFSTFNGPVIYRNGQIERIIRSERVDTIFYFTIQDNYNRYWFGTNRGLTLFRKEAFDAHETEMERILTYRRFTQNQGLIANELNAGGRFLASDGSIWLGTVEGMSQFFPDQVKENRQPPGLEFEEISISGLQVNPQQEVRLLHDHNFFQAVFTGLTYEAPEQVIYEHRLAGFDDEWEISRENNVNYPALPPGPYTFEVRAYNPDGARSIHSAIYSFTILPPFYFQWWFIVLMVLTIIGIILFSMHYSKISQQVDIERMRVQIASDLHDDVGSSLTELALQTDFLQAGDISPEIRNTLHQLGQHSRKIVGSLDDIVWSIDARNDTAGDLTDRMQDYVNQIFINGNVEVNYHFDELRMSEKLPVDVKENVYLIFKEAVNNVAKHSNAAVVDIKFSFFGKTYELIIRDNGTKTDSERKTGQGLRNIRMRAERIGSKVEIERNGGFTVKAAGSIK